MKVSRVDHVRTAVGMKKENTKKENIKKVNGVLYSYPNGTKEETIRLEGHVRKITRQSQRLYNVFVPTSTFYGADRKLAKDITNNFRMLIKTAVLMNWKPNMDQELLLKIQIKKLKNIQNQNINYPFKDKNQMAFIHEMVSVSLRSSLRKTVHIKQDNAEEKTSGKQQISARTVYVPEVIEKLIYAMCMGNNYAKEIRKIPEEEIRAFLVLINEDYGKERQGKNIVKSIKKQNVKVQYCEENGKLQLTSSTNEKKKYIFDFIKEYAAADEGERKNRLVHMRQLILLYYCGAEKYDAAQDSDLSQWSFGSLQEDISHNFSDRVIELINEKAQLLSKDKAQLRNISYRIKEELRQTIAQKYREAVSTPNLTPADKFWLQHFENCAQKILTSRSNIGPEKLSTAYLCDQTWKEWVSYIAMKYVDMGKAVYHFAMPDLGGIKEKKQVVIGEVLPEYRDGITSFDYERITAKESLERSLSHYITFAVNNFSRAVLSDEEREKKQQDDILLLKNTDSLYADTTRRILQYFGGSSTWKNTIWKGSTLDQCNGAELFDAIRQELATLRNSNFHYTAVINQGTCAKNPLVEQMFQKEFSEIGATYRKKFYSNNVPMFYKVEDINSLMDRLYNAPKERFPHMPSFNKIISRPALQEFIVRFVKGINLGYLGSSNVDSSVGDKYRSAMYFVLKEIYYYDFMQSEDIKERILKALKQQEENEKDKNRQKAIANFKERVDTINTDDVSFGEICQQLITDYERQNKEQAKKTSGKEKLVKQRDGSLKTQLVKVENTEQIYKHFKMLLYVCIREAFLDYLLDEENKEQFRFLREPELRENEFRNLSEHDFCFGWTAHNFDLLKESMRQDSQLQSWYVIAHFLNPKQLNHLIGSVKTYIEYVNNIEKRAAFTGNPVRDNIQMNVAQFQRLKPVLQFCMLFCGQISHELTDYFADEEDFARHLSNFVTWDDKERQNASTLKAFCQKEVKNGKNNGRIGIYYDNMNPIVNRNIVMSMLYGNEKLLSACMNPVEETDIQMYYAGMARLEHVFRSGICQNANEKRLVKEFQDRKNRIELVDVTIYSELVSDLLSQLVGWSYLRERDLMYMQLGFYYIKLFHTDSVADNHFLRKLAGDGIDIIDGGVLYQIAAMYSYDIPVYGLEQNKATLPKQDYPTGKNVMRFISDYCGGDMEIYKAGLCFFENVNEHDRIVKFRNYIDHFKYYSKTDTSILEMYSQMYDSFFGYDIKLKKSVSYVLENILMRYFVVPHLSFATCGEKSYEVKQDGCRKTITRKAAKITLGSKGLTSDIFTYKLPQLETKMKTGFVKGSSNRKQSNEVLVKARDDNFLEQLTRILEYKK